MFKACFSLAISCLLYFSTVAHASDWEEDEAPYKVIEEFDAPGSINVAPAVDSGFLPAPSVNPSIQGGDSGLFSGAPNAAGVLPAPLPNLPAKPNKSPGGPNWLDNYADKVISGAKSVAGAPKQLATGTGHLLKDPRFWTVTAGGAALGAAGVGTYFLLKNANRGNSFQQPVYIMNPATGALTPVAPSSAYQYGGVPAGTASDYPYSGYSSYSSTVFPGDHFVSSYMRKDGRFVSGHRQTNANDTMFDNYSSQGNMNPYTMKQGWILPKY